MWSAAFKCSLAVVVCSFFSRLIVAWQQIVNAKCNVYKAMDHIFSLLQSTLSWVSDFLWALGFVVSTSTAVERCAWCSGWSESLKLAQREHRCQKKTTTLKKRNGKCHLLLSEWIHEFLCELLVALPGSQHQQKALWTVYRFLKGIIKREELFILKCIG